MIYYLNLYSYNFLYSFVFDIVFQTHSSIYFIIFYHLIDFGFADTKKYHVVFVIF